MNKVFLLLAILVSVCSSCKKCYICKNKCTECVKSGEPSQTLCADQYTFSMDYTSAIDNYRAQGFSCNSVAGTTEDKICAGPLFVEPLRLAKEDEGYSCTVDK